MSPSVTISKHTTASSPRPHILYTVEVHSNGTKSVVEKRYSDFVDLDSTLGVNGRFTLPPKRILATTFIPSAWVDDELIAERKAGLTTYLSDVLRAPEYREHEKMKEFLSSEAGASVKFDLEDAVPSTLSRKKAMDLINQAEAERAADGEVTIAATTLACSYYPDWVLSSNPPESITFGKYDIIFFAFATPNSSSTLSWSSGGRDILGRLSAAAKNSGKGTQIVLSVGGWGGSYWFSQACSTSANRTKFVNAMAQAVKDFNIAGVDLDWEYPNSEGAGNPHSANDSANFLSLITSLRSALGSSKIISSAVPHRPWLGSNGNPMTDVSKFAAQMTYVNIMNYDVWGSSSNPGPNAPLGNLCGTSTQPTANAQAAFKQWTASGFPASKLMLGLPTYGYVSNSTRTKLTGSFAPTEAMSLIVPEEGEEKHFLNGAHPRNQEPQEVRVMADLRSWYGQQVPFNVLVSSGALVKSGDHYVGAGGFTYAWDDCSDTPFLYRTNQSTVVTFDDTYSLASKAKYAKSVGMAGVFTWSLDQDVGFTLQDAIRTAIGRPPPAK